MVSELTRILALATFSGFFFAMGIVNVITGTVMRSSASAAYAALMLVMVAITLYSIPHGSYGGLALHSTLIAAYLGCGVIFAFTLLRTMRFDRAIGQVTLAVLALNVLFVFAESLPAWKPFYIVDQVALDAMIVMLAVCGVRALAHEERLIAQSYLVGLVGPAVGLVVNDLSTNFVLPNSLWLIFSFWSGVAWEALFFAFAVALRNRGILGERDRFERLASLDGLTGVANRRAFDEALDRIWHVARRARVTVAIAMIDIDHFKRLNDTRGHQVGDECLRRVAALCSSVLRRAGDCFARYGGEEFAAILVNVDLDHARILAENMRKAVEVDGGITVSIGVAARIPEQADGWSLVADADRALYQAKSEGRNCVRAFELAQVEV